MNYDYDLIVLGAGSGGLPVIRGANQLGLKVAMIEKAKIGGDCLNTGCVPSKTFLKSAKVLHMMRNADRYGVPPYPVKTDFSMIMQRLRKVQGKIEEHENPEYFENLGVKVCIGPPAFEDKHRVRINGELLSAKKFVISTGSRAFVPPIEGADKTELLTNEEIFSLDSLPESLIVLGGGPIGVEMAQAFRRFGSEVTVIEMEPHILPREDPELARELQRLLEEEGIRIHTGSKVVQVGQDGQGKFAVLEKEGRKSRLRGSDILVSVGRRPNIEGLELENAGVKYTKRGITVSRRMQTSTSNIFAVGDVVGPYYFSHTAGYQAGVAFSNLFFRLPIRADLSVVPWVTFTDPELARAGLTEDEAKQQGIRYEVARFSFDNLDRTITESETEGFSKILISRGKIIGIHLLGSHAGESFHTLYLAMKNKIPVSKVSRLIYVYPTHSEIINRTLGQYFFKRIYSKWSKKIVRWIY